MIQHDTAIIRLMVTIYHDSEPSFTIHHVWYIKWNHHNSSNRILLAGERPKIARPSGRNWNLTIKNRGINWTNGDGHDLNNRNGIWIGIWGAKPAVIQAGNDFPASHVWAEMTFQSAVFGRGETFLRLWYGPKKRVYDFGVWKQGLVGWCSQQAKPWTNTGQLMNLPGLSAPLAWWFTHLGE